MRNKIWTTDWLASTPVFYNTETAKISHNINDVIDFERLELDAEGFNNYLEFGYSVLGQTPIKNIRYLEHSHSLTIGDDGKIKIEKLADEAEKLIGLSSQESEIIENLRAELEKWEQSITGEIIIPTSGGLDSRLLNYFIKDKKRIRSFTYGTSPSQPLSFEAVNAKLLAEKLGTNWELIRLDSFFALMDKWDGLYGPAVHAHGMYQLEFYQKIAEKVSAGSFVLSGIIGDAWAGSVNIGEIESVGDLKKLGYTHGMNADATQSLLQSGSDLRERYFKENKDKLKNDKWRVVEAMRFKMVLLSYLIKVPENCGFNVWSPFLKSDIAIGMLNLPEARKKNRLWQREFFKKVGLDLEKYWFKDRRNTLNLDILRKSKLPELNVDIFSGLVKSDYIRWINKTLDDSAKNLAWKKMLSLPLAPLYYLPKLSQLARKIDPYTAKNEEGQALNAYMTLKPIENILKKKR